MPGGGSDRCGCASLLWLLVVPATPAAADAPLTVTLAASAPQVSYGDDLGFTVTTTAAGLVRPDSFVELRRTGADGSSTVVAVNTADAAGRVTTERATYVAYARSFGEAALDEGTSAPVVVEVAFAVKPSASPTAIPPGGQLSVTAEVLPAVPGGSVVVEERLGAGPWRTVATGRTAADGSVAVPLGDRSKVGVYTLRVGRPAEGRWAAGAAEAVAKVTVTGTGPASAWRPIGGNKARPAHWGSCTIRYKVNPRRMPVHGMSDLREAFRRVTQLSGIRFRLSGRTSAVPYPGYDGPGVNKMVVAWATPRRVVVCSTRSPAGSAAPAVRSAAVSCPAT